MIEPRGPRDREVAAGRDGLITLMPPLTFEPQIEVSQFCQNLCVWFDLVLSGDAYSTLVP